MNRYIAVLCLAILCTTVAFADLIPFQETRSLFVLDEGTGQVLKIDQNGFSSVVVTKDEILTTTGGGDVDFFDVGIVFDKKGNMYFSEGDSGSILKRNKDTGALSALVTQETINTAVGRTVSDVEGLAFNSEGFLFANEDDTHDILKIDPVTGLTTVHSTAEDRLALLGPDPSLDADSGIIGVGNNGDIYIASGGDTDETQAIFKLAADGTSSLVASGAPFTDIDVFMTTDGNGDIYIADDGDDDHIYKIDVDTGNISVFISEDTLDSLVETFSDGDSTSADLEGGIAFDSDGNFYVAEENADIIIKFDTSLNASLFASEATLSNAADGTVDLEGGIAFSPVPEPSNLVFFSLVGCLLLFHNRRKHIG